MEENTYLKSAILEVVDNQLRANDPPETRQTFDRLISEGYSEEEAKKLIGCVVSEQIFVHIKAFSNKQRRPVGNEIVTYELSSDNRRRPCAENVVFGGYREKCAI